MDSTLEEKVENTNPEHISTPNDSEFESSGAKGTESEGESGAVPPEVEQSNPEDSTDESTPQAEESEQGKLEKADTENAEKHTEENEDNEAGEEFTKPEDKYIEYDGRVEEENEPKLEEPNVENTEEEIFNAKTEMMVVSTQNDSEVKEGNGPNSWDETRDKPEDDVSHAGTEIVVTSDEYRPSLEGVLNIGNGSAALATQDAENEVPEEGTITNEVYSEIEIEEAIERNVEQQNEAQVSIVSNVECESSVREVNEPEKSQILSDSNANKNNLATDESTKYSPFENKDDNTKLSIKDKNTQFISIYADRRLDDKLVSTAVPRPYSAFDGNNETFHDIYQPKPYTYYRDAHRKDYTSSSVFGQEPDLTMDSERQNMNQPENDHQLIQKSEPESTDTEIISSKVKPMKSENSKAGSKTRWFSGLRLCGCVRRG